MNKSIELKQTTHKRTKTQIYFIWTMIVIVICLAGSVWAESRIRIEFKFYAQNWGQKTAAQTDIITHTLCIQRDFESKYTQQQQQQQRK